jgi:hypothetical protein
MRGYQDANNPAVRFRNFAKIPYLSKITFSFNDTLIFRELVEYVSECYRALHGVMKYFEYI